MDSEIHEDQFLNPLVNVLIWALTLNLGENAEIEPKDVSWSLETWLRMLHWRQTPVFTLVDHGSDQQCVVPAKSAHESTVQLLIVILEEKSLTIYTDGFLAYDPLEDNETYQREAVIHGKGYVDGDVHVSTCESQATWGLKERADSVSQSGPAPAANPS